MNSPRINITMSDGDYHRLRQDAEKYTLTMSEIVRYSLKVARVLRRELYGGNRLVIVTPQGGQKEIVLPMWDEEVS